MPQSLSLIICHIIFSTKDREPFIDQDIRGSLHGYLATVVRDMDCTCYWAGGTCDHVHLAVRITRTIEVAALVEKIKTASSVWMKEQDRRFKKFAWQRGYGAFSIGPNSLEKLEKYIDITPAIYHIAY
jgi:putative transposase